MNTAYFQLSLEDFMKLAKFLTSVLVGSGLLMSNISSAYFPLEATFGCNTHKYTVRLDNNEGEVKTCDLSCHTKFHNEKHHVTVYPYESAMLYGTFGHTSTTCDVWCVGQYSGATQTLTVGGSCGFFD